MNGFYTRQAATTAGRCDAGVEVGCICCTFKAVSEEAESCLLAESGFDAASVQVSNKVGSQILNKSYRM
jgi:hypothetical protein